PGSEAGWQWIGEPTWRSLATAIHETAVTGTIPGSCRARPKPRHLVVQTAGGGAKLAPVIGYPGFTCVSGTPANRPFAFPTGPRRAAGPARLRPVRGAGQRRAGEGAGPAQGQGLRDRSQGRPGGAVLGSVRSRDG